MMIAWLLAAVVFGSAPAQAAPLTLAEAVNEALARSPDAEGARQRLREASLEEPLILSELDPQLVSGYSASDDQAPRAMPTFEGRRSQLERWNAGINQKTLLGTQMRLEYANSRLANPAAFRVLDPSVDSRLSIDLSQPLLRYFWGRPDVARRGRARASTAAAENQLRLALERAAAEAARAFLELHFALRFASIKEDGVAAAQKLLAKYQEKTGYGLAEESDLLQAKASLEVQRTELLIAQSQIERATNALRAALGRKDESGRLELAAPEGLPDGAALSVSEADALGKRPDVAASRRMTESLEWAARIQRLDTLPELTLNASYAFAGLDRRSSAAWDDMTGFDHPVKAAGINLIVPLTFKKERLLRKRADHQLGAAKADQLRLETAALKEIRDARDLHALAKQRLEAGRRLTQLERAKYKAEEANFRRGKSSTDLLIRFQLDIQRAESELLRAEIDEAAARIELARASGSLLEAFQR